jgi:hypothetical protein
MGDIGVQFNLKMHLFSTIILFLDIINRPFQASAIKSPTFIFERNKDPTPSSGTAPRYGKLKSINESRG